MILLPLIKTDNIITVIITAMNGTCAAQYIANISSMHYRSDQF